MEGETILAVVPGLQGNAGTWGAPRVYDLVLTNKRLVGVSKANLSGAFLAGGLLGGVIASRAAQGLPGPGPYDPSSLDALVGHRKGCFAIPFDQIERAKFSGLFGNFLKIQSGHRNFNLKVPSREREYLRDFFARVAHKRLR